MPLDAAHGLLLVVLGFLVGACGTLIGAGGGFVLVPVLLLLDPGAPPRGVTAVSLAVVFANALSGSIAYARAGRIDYRSGATFALFTLPGAVGGVFAAAHISRGGFSLAFGLALLGLAALTLRPPHAALVEGQAGPGRWWWERRIVEASGETHEYRFDVRIGAGLSAGVGFLASLLGIGGGVIHVPALVLLLRFPVHVATATSHFTLAFTALTATVVHALEGDLSGPATQLEVLLLVAGVLPGAQVGARLARRARGTWVLRLLALALALVGLRLLVVGARSL